MPELIVAYVSGIILFCVIVWTALNPKGFFSYIIVIIGIVILVIQFNNTIRILYDYKDLSKSQTHIQQGIRL